MAFFCCSTSKLVYTGIIYITDYSKLKTCAYYTVCTYQIENKPQQEGHPTSGCVIAAVSRDLGITPPYFPSRGIRYCLP